MGDEIGQPFAGDGDRRDDGDAKPLREFVGVDLDAEVTGFVNHVQGQHDGQARFDQLEGQAQHAIQVLGVDDVYNGTDPPGEEHIAGDAFLIRDRKEAVHARGVCDLDVVAECVAEALGDFNCCARVVRDRHILAGQLVE